MAIDIVHDELIDVSEDQFKLFMTAYHKLTSHALLDQYNEANNTHNYIDLKDRKYVYNLRGGYYLPAILFSKSNKDGKTNYQIHKKLYNDISDLILKED